MARIKNFKNRDFEKTPEILSPKESSRIARAKNKRFIKSY